MWSIVSRGARRAPSLPTRPFHTSFPAFAAASPLPSPSSPSSPSATPRARPIRRTAVPASTRRATTPTPAPTPAPAFTPTAATFQDLPELEAELDGQDVSGIDDYAHLAPVSVSPPAARGRSRKDAQSTATATFTPTPTPSPPLTSLPQGESTLPILTRQPDIQGEVSAPSGADWSTSFSGLSERPFSKEAAEALLKPLHPDDVEVKPDGLLYLPEIKYRRTLNAAFGPGGWGLAPRGETNVGPKIVSREWGLVCLGRLVSVARGEQEYFDPSGVPTATEACKSNALMRCCKDLGIASELWDPRFIREFKAKYCEEAFVEHQGTKRKRKLWKKKGGKFDYPYKEV